MVHTAHHAPCRVEDDIKVDHAQRVALIDHTQQYDQVSHQDGREQFKEIFNPEMNNPEAPEVSRCEMPTGMCEQADGIERRDGKGREEEELR